MAESVTKISKLTVTSVICGVLYPVPCWVFIYADLHCREDVPLSLQMIAAVLFLVLPPIGLVCGLLGRRTATRNNEVYGKRLATFGVRLASLGLAAWVCCVLFLPEMECNHIAAHEASAVGSLRRLSEANKVYAAEHHGSFAPTLNDFDGLIDRDLLKGVKRGYNFRYVAGKENKGGLISSYQVFAQPVAQYDTGNRYFFTDQTGIMRWGANSVNAQSEPLQ